MSSDLRSLGLVTITCAVVLLLLPACAGDMDGEPVGIEGSRGEVHAITVWNTSQFAIREIESIPPAEDSSLQPIVIGALERGEHIVVENFVSGSTLTFVRDKVQGGDALKITTQSPVYVDGPGFTLLIWDDAFRLLTPQHERNPFGAVGAEEDVVSEDVDGGDLSSGDVDGGDLSSGDVNGDGVVSGDTDTDLP